MNDTFGMTSSRPYMLRAIHQWIVDNDCTPYLLVDADQPGVKVPPQAVKDGKVVLNIAPAAISGMEMGNDEVMFLTRFSGVSMRVRVPMFAVKAIYAQENGQGMMFADEQEPPAPTATETAGTDTPASGSDDDDGPGGSGGKPARGASHLRVIK